MPSASAASISARSAARFHHGAGRIRRARDHHALDRLAAMFGNQSVGWNRPARFRRRLYQHRLAAERGEDVPVRRIAGVGERDAIAGFELRQEGEDEIRRTIRW